MIKFSNKNYIPIINIALILLILPLRSFAEQPLRPFYFDLIEWIAKIMTVFLIPSIALTILGERKHRKNLKMIGICGIILFFVSIFLWIFIETLSVIL